MTTKRARALKEKAAEETSATATHEDKKLSSKSLTRAAEKAVSEGFLHVIGMDEAGRGPLAGPVVAAACYLPPDTALIDGIADSKLLTETDREHAFAQLLADEKVQFAYCVVDHKEIDALNILQASMTAMARSADALLAGMGLLPRAAIHATAALKPSLQAALDREEEHVSLPEHATVQSFLGLVDGNRVPSALSLQGKSVIQGDRKIYSIAAASIVAKVTRDRIMVELDKQFPLYLFAQHKGYPTAAHRALVALHGPCEVHRRSYGPVKNAIAAREKKLEKENQKERESDAREGEGEENDDEKKTTRRRRASTTAAAAAKRTAVSDDDIADAPKTTRRKRDDKGDCESLSTPKRVVRSRTSATPELSVALDCRRSPRLAGKR